MVTYRTLMRWMKVFEIGNAVPWIVHNPVLFKRNGLKWQLIANSPNFFLRALTPIYPSFVFVLVKPETLDAHLNNNPNLVIKMEMETADI